VLHHATLSKFPTLAATRLARARLESALPKPQLRR
jgi:hypothetical protein